MGDKALSGEGVVELPDVYFALDGEDEPTLWLRSPLNPHGDKALARRCEMDPTAWAVLVVAVDHANHGRPSQERS